jgi:hypothetical protein
MRRLLVVTAVFVLALVPYGPGAAGRPSVSSLYLGVTGDSGRFKGQTGQISTIQNTFIGWDQGRTYGTRLPVLLRKLGPVPMIHIGTGHLARTEAITPLAIAQGNGDAFLVALNQAIAEYGGLVYLRLLSEMNHFSHFHSAFNANGSSRGAAYRPEVFRKMFARMHLLLHGGPAAKMNSRLVGKLGLPTYAGEDLPSNPPSRLRVIWNPLGGGQPAITKNAHYQFYPGDRYLEIVGNDLYGAVGQFAQPQNEVLYAFAREHRKPFALPEWGVKSTDYPAFVRYVCTFLRTHAGIELAAYFKSQPGGMFDLANKPGSRQVYRRCITPLGRKAS